MSLFWQEMRKIWQPRLVAGLLVLGVLFYFLRLSTYTEVLYGVGEEYEATLQLEQELIQRFGSSLESEEALLLTQEPVDTTADVQNILQKFANIQNSDFYLTTLSGFSDMTLQQQERLAELEAQRRSGLNLLNEIARINILGYLPNLAVWIVASIILLLSPTLVRDKLRRTQALQWTSLTGRNILRTQITAGLCSALLLTLLNLGIFSLPLLTQGITSFLDCSFFLASYSPFPWFDWTLGQYLLAMGILMLLLGLITGALTLFLSLFSTNYVPMMLKAIPLFVVLGMGFAMTLYNETFCFMRSNRLFAAAPPTFEMFIIAVALILSLILCVAACNKLKRQEL